MRALLAVVVLSAVAVGAAMLRVLQLRGEWSAMVLIVDAGVLVFAGLVFGLGGALHLGKRRRLAMALWAAAGPLPLALFAVFHCRKVFG